MKPETNQPTIPLNQEGPGSTAVATQSAPAPQAPAIKKLTEMTTKELFESDAIKKKFNELMGQRGAGFVTSVLQLTASNTNFTKVAPLSIYNAVCIAAALDLAVNPNLGQAWVIPYGDKAQFQMGWKGYVQLAQRSGQYRTLGTAPIYKNQFRTWNLIEEKLEADFTMLGSGEVAGYVAYFELLNGFKKMVYWTKEQVMAHGKKYSKSFNSGPWRDEFDKMAMKTVVKNMLGNWGILSIEMQRAIALDQGVIVNPDTDEVEYIDAAAMVIGNEGSSSNEQKETERFRDAIKACASEVALSALEPKLKEKFPDLQADYDKKLGELLALKAASEAK